MSTEIKVVHENDLRWNVQCVHPGCTNVISVPKKITYPDGEVVTHTEPAPVRCINHPPPPK